MTIRKQWKISLDYNTKLFHLSTPLFKNDCHFKFYEDIVTLGLSLKGMHIFIDQHNRGAVYLNNGNVTRILSEHRSGEDQLKIMWTMNNECPILRFAESVKSDLRLQGYCSIFCSEDEGEQLRRYLLEDFNILILIRLSEEKLYFIVNQIGQKSVMKFINASINTIKKTQLDSLGIENETVTQKLEILRESLSQLETVKFDN